VDYGTVLKDNGDGTVDVQHAVPVVPKYPDANPSANVITPTVSHSVEVLYMASANFGSTFKLTPGDFVLLVGLKDFVPTTTKISPNPQAPAAFYHYSQNTLKAIPLAGTNAMANAQINVVNGLIQIKNTAQSLATILETFSTQGPPPYHMVAPDTITKLQMLLTP
jgi:hypothetical protein